VSGFHNWQIRIIILYDITPYSLLKTNDVSKEHTTFMFLRKRKKYSSQPLLCFLSTPKFFDAFRCSSTFSDSIRRYPIFSNALRCSTMLTDVLRHYPMFSETLRNPPILSEDNKQRAKTFGLTDTHSTFLNLTELHALQPFLKL
jgi:hypothetical protein